MAAAGCCTPWNSVSVEQKVRRTDLGGGPKGYVGRGVSRTLEAPASSPPPEAVFRPVCALRLAQGRDPSEPTGRAVGVPSARCSDGDRHGSDHLDVVALCRRRLKWRSAAVHEPGHNGLEVRLKRLHAVALKSIHNGGVPALVDPRSDPRADRVQVHVGHRRHQRLLAEQRTRVEALLEEVPPAVVLQVRAARHRLLEVLHVAVDVFMDVAVGSSEWFSRTVTDCIVYLYAKIGAMWFRKVPLGT